MARERVAKKRLLQKLRKAFSDKLSYGIRSGTNVVNNSGPSINQSDDVLQIMTAVIIAFSPVLKSLKFCCQKKHWTNYSCCAVFPQISRYCQREGFGKPPRIHPEDR